MPNEFELENIARANAAPPTDPIGTEHTAIGIVKWWKSDKGYGAITCADFAPWDVWYHYSSIVPAAEGVPREIEQGAQVEVLFVRANQESFKYVAESVRRLKG